MLEGAKMVLPFCPQVAQGGKKTQEFLKVRDGERERKRDFFSGRVNKSYASALQLKEEQYREKYACPEPGNVNNDNLMIIIMVISSSTEVGLPYVLIKGLAKQTKVSPSR